MAGNSFFKLFFNSLFFLLSIVLFALTLHFKGRKFHRQRFLWFGQTEKRLHFADNNFLRLQNFEDLVI